MTAPLPPTTQGFALSPPAPVTIELFLDLICPFSMKMFTCLYDNGIFKAYEGKVSFVMQNVPQVWHPQGAYVHEVALLVKTHQPEVYAAVVRALYGAFEGGFGKFTDADTFDKSRSQIYDEILDVAATAGQQGQNRRGGVDRHSPEEHAGRLGAAVWTPVARLSGGRGAVPIVLRTGPSCCVRCRRGPTRR